MTLRGRLPPQNYHLKKDLTIPYLFSSFYAILPSLMNTEHLNPEQAKAVNTINAFGADYCGGTVEQLYIRIQLLNDEFF